LPEQKTATALEERMEAPQVSTPQHAVVPADYMNLVRLRLEKVKHYPFSARRLGAEGIVTLAFTLDRSGHLLHWRIEKRSGIELLDDEGGEMLERATPFPPFPPSLEGNHLDLVIPVEFSLHKP
jgi:protein TonB